MRRWVVFVVLSWSVVFRSAYADSILERQRKYPRVRSALLSHAANLKSSFLRAGARWNPRIFIRIFKQEGTLELWAAPQRGHRWVLVNRYSICVSSGDLGPKRFEGDLQVPEGFYRLTLFNPQSAFHLSMRINYPNRVDRFYRQSRRSLGGDIYIHGGCASIGCVPIEDESIERLYVASLLAKNSGQKRIAVHSFPCRMDTDTCKAALATASAIEPVHKSHWEGLMLGYSAFESTRIPPLVRSGSDGKYRVQSFAGCRTASTVQ